MAHRSSVRIWTSAALGLFGLVLVAIVVTAVVIAQDPAGAAGNVNSVLYSLDDAAKTVLLAPIHFFQALLTFVERLFD